MVSRGPKGSQGVPRGPVSISFATSDKTTGKSMKKLDPKGSQGVPRGPKGSQGVPRHSKCYLITNQAVLGVLKSSEGCCRGPKGSQGVPRGPKGSQGIPRNPMSIFFAKGDKKTRKNCIPRSSNGFQGVPRGPKGSQVLSRGS